VAFTLQPFKIAKDTAESERGPAGWPEIKAYFIEQQNLIEIDSAADKLRDHKSGNPQQSPEAN